MTDSSDAPRLKATPALPALGTAGPWLALVILAIWTRELAAGWLVVASSALFAGVLARTGPSRIRGVGLFLLIGSVVAAFVGQHQLDRLTSSWEEYWAERRDGLGKELEARINDLIDRGDQAAVGLALLADG